MTNQGSVCVVGSINADRFVGLARLPQPGETVLGSSLGLYAGGKGLNQAVAAARCGAETRMCGAVGADVEGAFLREAMREIGLNTDYVSSVDDATGAAYVFSLSDAENSIVVAQGANAAVSADDATAAVRGVDVVLTQLEIAPRVAALALAAGKELGAVTILNAAPAHPSAWDMLSDVDILVVNEGEALALGGVGALGEHVTIIETRGAAGVTVHPRGEQPFEVAAFPIVPVDTTGAGDAFCGALAAAIARGADLATAVREGAAAGAIVAQHRGAQVEALSAEAVDQLVGEASFSAARSSSASVSAPAVSASAVSAPAGSRSSVPASAGSPILGSSAK